MFENPDFKVNVEFRTVIEDGVGQISFGNGNLSTLSEGRCLKQELYAHKQNLIKHQTKLDE